MPTHPCLRRRSSATPGASPAVLPLPALVPGASRPPGRCRRSACSALAGTGATSRGAQRSGRRRHCRRRGSQAEERSWDEENGSGRRGTVARDPNPQPRSQRSLPGGAPALVCAPSCRRRRYCSAPGCSQLPITADADARPSPSLSSPPLPSLSLSPPPKPRAQRARGREAPASGMTSDLGAPRWGEGAGGKGDDGGGAASWRALRAPGLEAGLILELESSPTGSLGLQDNTNVPWWRGRDVVPASESSSTPLSVSSLPQPRAEVQHMLLSEDR